MKYILKVNNLKFRYSANSPYILNSINMKIKRNTINAIAGLSGCGKSTLAFALCGAIPKSLAGITEGNILLEGKNIKEEALSTLAKKIGIVFQEVDNQLFLPTVEAEIAFAPENFCLSYNEIDTIIEKVLKDLKIEKLRYKNPSSLSGGEKHLIAIASVLSMDPDIIILDEVLSNLDDNNKSLIINTISLLKDSGKTIIFIDHNIKNLMIADYIYLMESGKIKETLGRDMSNELLQNKLNDFFLSQI